MLKNIPQVPVKQDYIRLSGGLEQEASHVMMSPGTALTAINYEPLSGGGFGRIDGYERFDGRPSPSEQLIYYYCPCAFTGAVAISDVITGATSSITATVLYVGADYLVIINPSAIFTLKESFKVGGVTKGTFTEIPLFKGASTAHQHAVFTNELANYYRSQIARVPGSFTRGVNGLVMLKGVLYAFMNVVGDASAGIWKSSASGWQAITLYKQIGFSAGNQQITDGTLIVQTTTGATAIVKRQILETGAYLGGSATGRLILSNITGTFNSTAPIQVSGITRCTAASLATQISLLPNGKYEFSTYNFYSSQDTIRVYGCDGVNPAFEFDGDVYIPINTGMSPDNPKHIKAHKSMLFLSFNASLQNSGIGSPFTWTVTTGASEIGLGENITALQTQPGDVLAVATRNSLRQLSGSSTLNFKLDVISSEVGCIEYSSQQMGSMVMFDDRGVIKIAQSQNYGNFEHFTISKTVQKLIDRARGKVVCSNAYKDKNQIRWYCNDGTGVIMTVAPGKVGDTYNYSEFKYPVTVTASFSGEDASGKDVVFFGDSSGMVYQANKGTSFDGQDIEAFLMLAFTHSGTVNYIKRYRRAAIDFRSLGYSNIRINPNFSYNDGNIQEHINYEAANNGVGDYWDVGTWNEFNYDASLTSRISMPIFGSGVSLSMGIYSKSSIDLGHRIDGFLLQYTVRRIVR